MQTRQTVARTHEAPACFFAGALRVMRERVSKLTGNAAARKRTSSRTSLPSRASAMKFRTYFYNSITRYRPAKTPQPPHERCFSAAFRSHPRESAMKPGTYFYNLLTRHRPRKDPQSPRDRLLFSRTPLLFLHVGDETPNLSLQSANASSPNENPPVTARLPVFSHALRPPPRVGDETPNLYLQSANTPSPSPASLRARPIIETTRRHRLRGLSRAIAKRRPWRKIAGNRPARGFQNFSIECSIFVHKKAKMGGYTVSIETKGGNGL